MGKSANSIHRILSILLLFSFLFLLTPNCAYAIVYSVDGLIDVERMAVDKIYYDLYYNPETKVFSRSDAEELSPEAQALINKATQLKVSRAVHADNAGEVEYSQITGENNCWDEESFTGSTGESTGGSTGKFIGPFGEEIGCSTNENNEPKYTFDPFVGSGTEVNPEIQSLQKPACLTGWAKIADENMGYVYMVDMADRSLNAKTAEVNSFRAGVFESPVPRVFKAPSAPTAIKAEELVVHDNGQLVWKDGQPVGVWVKNCEEAGPEDQRCFKVVKDDHLPERTNFAHWVNSSNYVSGILEGEDPTKIKVLKTERTLNKNEAGIIVSRNYSFLIDKYTLTKGVLFCDVGWRKGAYTDFMVDVDGLPDITVSYYGGTLGRYITEDCEEEDSSGNCLKRKYRIIITDACYTGAYPDLQPGSITSGSISVVNQPVTVSITLPGHDIRLEPENVSGNTALIYAAAQSQLPGLIYIGNEKVKTITKCSGNPQYYYSCY